MSEIIENGSDPAASSSDVSVGDRSSQVPLKVYQEIYKQINGRTEEIRKRYSENLLIEFEEVQQLHYKIMQLCEVHRVIASSESVSIFHEKERKEQFTSFEKFKSYNSSSTSPSLNLVLKYNFSIIAGNHGRTQEYIVTIKLNSRIAVMKQLHDGSPFVNGRLLNLLGNAVAEITVEYSDYVVARGFIESFDEWVKGCDCTPSPTLLHFFQRRSHNIPNTIKLLIFPAMAFSALSNIDIFLTSSSSITEHTRFLILYGSAAYLVILISGILGRIIESSIDSYPVLSYLRLNRGDEKIIGEFRSKRKLVAINFFLGAFLTIALGIIATKLEKLL